MKNKTLPLPQHIAFIIDGNGRWAKKRGMPRMMGHKFGFKTLLETIENVYNEGIPFMSVYAFSQENWNRPQQEVDGLMQLFREIFKDEQINQLSDKAKIIFSGDINGLADDIRENAEKLMKKTENNTTFTLNLCINYGGRQEILRAVNNIIADNIQVVDDSIFRSFLYTKDLPDPDFVVRTSGENRISNFLPYQLSYSELYFPKVLWPDFTKKKLMKALIVFSKRDRRFGAIKGTK